MYVKLAILIAGAALIAGVFYYGYTTGYSSRDAEYIEAAVKEQERQRLQNEEAQKASQEREQELLSEITRLRKLSRRLIDDAYKDPNSDRPAIGADSVRRLNSIDATTGPR